MNLGFQVIECSTLRFPQQPALLMADAQISYSQLLKRIESFSAGLAAQGVKPGDRVAFMMNNHAEVVVAFFAILRLGAIAVATNVMLKQYELSYLLNDSGACAIVCESAVAPIVLASAKEAPALRSIVVVGDELEGTLSFAALEDGKHASVPVAHRLPDETAFITYTSGTTGKPKGVMMSHFWLDYVTVGWVNVLRISHADRVLILSPFFYINGSVVKTLAAFRIGAAAIFIERFKARPVLDLIKQHRATASVIVPTAVVQLLDEYDPVHDDVSSMTSVFTSGAPASAVVKQRLADVFGWVPREIYGLSEAHMLAAGSMNLPPKAGMVGFPAANTIVRVVDDEGREVPRGTVGEFICKGDSVTSGYWQRPDDTAETYKDGWLRTGDLGVMDDDGYLKVVDRRKEMIITGGANIYPAEVELTLVRHHAVASAVVVGRPDKDYGELAVAVIVPQPTAKVDREDVIAFCREHLAVYKCPREVVFVDALPLTASGKVARQEIKAMVRAGADA